jgi:uncharacterized protein (DUF1501 family)
MTSRYHRREFLSNALYASLAGGAALGLSWPARAAAACLAVDMPRTLVNVMLYGGMDSRFIFMPAPNHDATVSSSAYLDKLWAARASLYPGGYPGYAEMFAAEYLPVTDPASGLEFGVHNSCGWLKAEFDQGRVAVIANTYCSRNRRHDQSQLNANIGQPDYDQLVYTQSGWGGRLVEQLGAANTIELSHELSVFGNGSADGERLQQVIHAQNTRDIALPDVRDDRSVTDNRNVMTRALKAYYQARGAEVATAKPSTWPYHLFYQHNATFRAFGDAIRDRLEACGDLPPTLASLTLNQGHFAQQCRNLYDVCLAPDILGVGAVSMRYSGWDTHNGQHGRITANLSDLFGSAGGLATAMNEISLLPSAGAPVSDSLVFSFTSDFGRQLRVNGDRGTDHGRGIYTILIGNGVNGGVYGEMFPERESSPDGNGRIPLQTSGADIEGRTSTELVLGQVCEWVQPGSSASVFPDADPAAVEEPGLLDNLLGA